MTLNTPHTEIDEQKVKNKVKKIKKFYIHILEYLFIMSGLYFVNIYTSPHNIWAWWVALVWGIGLLLDGIICFEVFGLLDSDWERKEIKKRMRNR